MNNKLDLNRGFIAREECGFQNSVHLGHSCDVDDSFRLKDTAHFNTAMELKISDIAGSMRLVEFDFPATVSGVYFDDYEQFVFKDENNNITNLKQFDTVMKDNATSITDINAGFAGLTASSFLCKSWRASFKAVAVGFFAKPYNAR